MSFPSCSQERVCREACVELAKAKGVCRERDLGSAPRSVCAHAPQGPGQAERSDRGVRTRHPAGVRAAGIFGLARALQVALRADNR